MRLILLICLLLPFLLDAQLSISVTIRTTEGGVLANSNTYILSNGEKKQSQVTDANGKVTYEVSEEGNYTFYYADDVKGFDFEMKEGRRGSMSKTLTYDPEGVFKRPEKADRKGIQFAIKEENITDFSPATGKAGYQIVLKNLKGVPAKGVSVVMVDFISKTKFSAKTNSRGMAKFFINSGQSYEIDIDGIEAVDIIKVPRVKYGVFTSELPYEAPKLAQRIVGDTIYQSQITQTDGATTHAFAVIKLVDFNQEGLSDEKVFLNDENSSKVYAGTTDEDGEVKFMLKNGTNYIMSLQMERDVRYIKLGETRGFKKVGLTHMYRGTENVLSMLANRKRDDKGFIQNFESTPIKKLEGVQIKSNYGSNGLRLKIEENGKVPTITLVEGNAYFSEGFYSKKFFAFDVKTKKVVWAVELGESGAGTAVYSDGVLLINTYSCTLYALDVKTGELLWSKYLANTLYSNPSVSNGNVLVVFDNEISLGKNDRFVMANFDLKTGKTKWQTLISEDAIACPVISGSEVHVASTNGNYKVFEMKSGKVVNEANIQAVSSPTITKKKIYLTRKEGESEVLSVYDKKTFKKLKDITISDSTTEFDTPCFEKMHHQGSRVVAYKGLNYLISGSSLMCIDPVAEKIIWKQDIGLNGNLRAIMVANNRVFVQTGDDFVLFYEALTGNRKTVIKTLSSVYAQPTATRRKLFYSDDSGYIYMQSIPIALEVPQWLGNSEHNRFYED